MRALTLPDSAGALSLTPVSTTATVVRAPSDRVRARDAPSEVRAHGSVSACRVEAVAHGSSAANETRTAGSSTDSAAAGAAPAATSSTATTADAAVAASGRWVRAARMAHILGTGSAAHRAGVAPHLPCLCWMLAVGVP